MKTVLFLINGFGIERKGSYSVYDEKLMPTFDSLTKRYMFSKLDSNVKDVHDGYRNMSLEVDGLYNYSVYDRESKNGNIMANGVILDVQKEIIERKSKLHLFCFIDTSMEIIENLKHFIKFINKERDKNIFLHLVLTSKNYEDYPQIIEVMSKINLELGEYAKIGFVTGLLNLLNSVSVTDLNFFLRNIISESGERWASFKQKLDVSYGMKTPPALVNYFVVNTGFGIGNNDLFFIWNYDNVDITNFINGIKSIDYQKNPNNIKFYSLFPITYSEQIPNVLNFEIAKKSLATNMAGLNFKTLVAANNDDIGVINYYLNGMQQINNPEITFLKMDDVQYNGDLLVNIINSYPQEFMIINYSIKDVTTIEELEESLKKIDEVLGKVYENTSKNSYNIIVSSTFGMDKTLTRVDTGEVCNILYNKVPLIYVNGLINRSVYMLEDGKISDLFRVCYKSINEKYPGETLIVKKNLLYRLIFK